MDSKEILKTLNKGTFTNLTKLIPKIALSIIKLHSKSTSTFKTLAFKFFENSLCFQVLLAIKPNLLVRFIALVEKYPSLRSQIDTCLCKGVYLHGNHPQFSLTYLEEKNIISLLKLEGIALEAIELPFKAALKLVSECSIDTQRCTLLNLVDFGKLDPNQRKKLAGARKTRALPYILHDHKLVRHRLVEMMLERNMLKTAVKKSNKLKLELALN